MHFDNVPELTMLIALAQAMPVSSEALSFPSIDIAPYEQEAVSRLVTLKLATRQEYRYYLTLEGEAVVKEFIERLRSLEEQE